MAKSFDIAMFHPSDGFTPIQLKKLNQNFERLLAIAAGKEENAESENRTAEAVRKILVPVVMDLAYPVGTLVFAKDEDSLPKWGSWREVETYDGRFVRIGGNFGRTGGSATATVEAVLPRHRHSLKQKVADKTVKVDESSSAGAKQAISSLKDADAYTGYEGDGEDQLIDIIPPFVDVRLFERYA